MAERIEWAASHKDWNPLGQPMTTQDRVMYQACKDGSSVGCSYLKEKFPGKPGKPPAKDRPKRTKETRGTGTFPPSSEDGGPDDAEGSGEDDSMGSPGEGSQPLQTPARPADSVSRAAAAMDRARRMGDALRGGLPAAEEPAPESPETAGRGSAPGKGAGAAPDDLVLAAVGGFAGALEGLASEPQALMRRPDFFQVLPRPSFESLKQDLRERPDFGETDLRHVGLSESSRDIVHTDSCEKLSGRCNPHVGRLSYRKGEEVPPEDLRRMHAAIHGEDEDGGLRESFASEEADPAPAAQSRGNPLPKDTVRGMYGRINGVIRGIRRFLGLESAVSSVRAGHASGPRALSAAQPTAVPRGGSAAPPPPRPLEGLQQASRLAGRLIALAALAWVALRLLRRP